MSRYARVMSGILERNLRTELKSENHIGRIRKENRRCLRERIPFTGKGIRCIGQESIRSYRKGYTSISRKSYAIHCLATAIPYLPS